MPGITARRQNLKEIAAIVFAAAVSDRFCPEIVPDFDSVRVTDDKRQELHDDHYHGMTKCTLIVDGTVYKGTIWRCNADPSSVYVRITSVITTIGELSDFPHHYQRVTYGSHLS